MSLIQNALYIPSQDRFVVSAHVHDWVSFEVDGEKGFIDGGRDYRRQSIFSTKLQSLVEDYCLDDYSGFDELRDKLLWGTYGKDGAQPLKWKRIKDLEQEHRKTILKTQPHIPPVVREVLIYWISRNEKNCVKEKVC